MFRSWTLLCFGQACLLLCTACDRDSAQGAAGAGGPASGPAAAHQLDRYGGWPGVRGQATGFFHVEQIGGVWWLLTPDGNAFLSKGVNNVNYQDHFSPKLGRSPHHDFAAAQYGSEAKWAKVSAARLRQWGFNTVGTWSSMAMYEQAMPYTFGADLALSAGADWQYGKVADVFSPQFEAAVRRKAEEVCRPRVKDPFLVGYFTDNELHWEPDWRSKETLFEESLRGPADRPGKQALVRLLRSTCNTVEVFNTAWGTRLNSLDELATLTSLPLNTPAARAASSQFLSQYARIYFKTCHDAIRAVDRNHLILGCRFAGSAPPDVVREMGPFVDVASLNSYSLQPPVDQLARLHRLTRRPVMLTEFSFYAKDSGLPNGGPGRILPRQQDRAERYERHVTELVRWPFVVGFHWFGYLDFPAEGAFDGESNNCGLVNVRDEPWTVLVERMSRVNPGLEAAHARPGKELLIPVEARAFGGHHYWVVPETMIWPEAKAACEDMNGHLAIIQSDSENQFLRKLAGRTWLWIGCSLDRPSGKWTWVDGSALSYTNWSVREKQPTGGPNEIFMSMSPNGRWHDHNSDDKLGYICEWDY